MSVQPHAFSLMESIPRAARCPFHLCLSLTHPTPRTPLLVCHMSPPRERRSTEAGQVQGGFSPVTLDFGVETYGVYLETVGWS